MTAPYGEDECDINSYADWIDPAPAYIRWLFPGGYIEYCGIHDDQDVYRLDYTKSPDGLILRDGFDGFFRAYPKYVFAARDGSGKVMLYDQGTLPFELWSKLFDQSRLLNLSPTQRRDLLASEPADEYDRAWINLLKEHSDAVREGTNLWEAVPEAWGVPPVPTAHYTLGYFEPALCFDPWPDQYLALIRRGRWLSNFLELLQVLPCLDPEQEEHKAHACKLMHQAAKFFIAGPTGTTGESFGLYCDIIATAKESQWSGYEPPAMTLFLEHSEEVYDDVGLFFSEYSEELFDPDPEIIWHKRQYEALSGRLNRLHQRVKAVTELVDMQSKRTFLSKVDGTKYEIEPTWLYHCFLSLYDEEVLLYLEA